MKTIRIPAPSPPTSKYVAFLRGINVAGKNMLPMPTLAQMFRDSGCIDVQTYIQSGNVLFKATGKIYLQLAAAIDSIMEDRCGFKVPIVLRSAAELHAVLRNNPFLNAGAAPEMQHVYFLRDHPRPADVAGLDPNRSAPDAFAVLGREVYLQLPAGMARTKLTNAYFDTRLKTVSTARNWRTVQKLADLLST